MNPVAASRGAAGLGPAGSHKRALPWAAVPFLLVAIAYFVIPVYIMFKVSVSSPGEVLTAHPSFTIQEFTAKHWRDVLTSGNLAGPLRKSLTVATGTTLICLLVAAPASYAIARLPRGLRYGLIMALFFTRMFPDVGIALPIAVQFLKWNLTDTDLGLMLAHLTLVLPWAAWVMVGTFTAIPRDLEEAAAVDGASRLRTLLAVVTPLALPGLAVAAIFIWLASWNEFTFAMFLTLSDRTLPLQTYYYVNRGNWFQAAAYSGLLTLPVMLVTLFFQRYLRAGYLSGAVKG
jgi:trehalose transport system permease protein